MIEDKYRIRKLTPREDLRLMGWYDEDIDKIENIGMSDNQMIKQAGNGIVINCVSLLFEHLYKAQYDADYQCSDEVFLQAQATI